MRALNCSQLQQHILYSHVVFLLKCSRTGHAISCHAEWFENNCRASLYLRCVTLFVHRCVKASVFRHAGVARVKRCYERLIVSPHQASIVHFSRFPELTEWPCETCFWKLVISAKPTVVWHRWKTILCKVWWTVRLPDHRTFTVANRLIVWVSRGYVLNKRIRLGCRFVWLRIILFERDVERCWRWWLR
jgi:hypothetical protein